MGRISHFGGLALCIAIMGCDAGGDAPANDAAPVENAATNTAEAGPVMPDCLFRETKEWAGSIEGGRLLVTGRVDAQMAGFTPTLNVRSSNPPTIALDLTLEPVEGAPAEDKVDYVQAGAPAYRRGEIWCGGEMIETFDIVFVG